MNASGRPFGLADVHLSLGETGTASSGPGYLAELDAVDGHFEFAGVPAGSYEMVATAGTCSGRCAFAGAEGELVEVQVFLVCNF